MRTIHRNIVAALIFSKDGKLLQGKKDPADGGVYADCWHLPGGGVEEGEDTITAIVREIKEETGIVVAPEAVKLADDSGSGESEKTLPDTGERVWCRMSFSVYQVTLEQNARDVVVSLNGDLVAYQWTERTELKNIKITPPSLALFARLGYI